ncbi:hypothetical protein NMY22_g13031 [Coprinellus aureogranulatus]|nr:hypothetical protein NMY22_g13031 [Coprinellus aureogranulatus]
MVGWVPLDINARKSKAARFIQRVKQSQIQPFGPDDVPIILQYDQRFADLCPWLWPIEDGIAVRPDELDRYRYTHYFKGPCCPCTMVHDSPFTESKIGLAQIVMQPATAQCLGQYVAICSMQECGYFDVPIKIMDPFIFTTGDTEETMKKRAARDEQTYVERLLHRTVSVTITTWYSVLKREDPERFLELQKSLQTLLVKGLPAEKFWDLFVQCTACMYVMPHQYFPYYHACMVDVVHPQLGLPRDLRSPKVRELPSSEVNIDYYAAMPAPSSDDVIGDDVLLRLVAGTRAKRQAEGDPVTPKAKRGQRVA